MNSRHQVHRRARDALRPRGEEHVPRESRFRALRPADEGRMAHRRESEVAPRNLTRALKECGLQDFAAFGLWQKVRSGDLSWINFAKLALVNPDHVFVRDVIGVLEKEKRDAELLILMEHQDDVLKTAATRAYGRLMKLFLKTDGEGFENGGDVLRELRREQAVSDLKRRKGQS